jgi:hypothetical protein
MVALGPGATQLDPNSLADGPVVIRLRGELPRPCANMVREVLRPTLYRERLISTARDCGLLKHTYSNPLYLPSWPTWTLTAFVARGVSSVIRVSIGLIPDAFFDKVWPRRQAAGGCHPSAPPPTMPAASCAVLNTHPHLRWLHPPSRARTSLAVLRWDTDGGNTCLLPDKPSPTQARSGSTPGDTDTDS